MPGQNIIPRFFLYGEAGREVELDFLHIERVRSRSSQHDWTIPAHAHPDHCQLLLLTEGGSTLRVEADQWRAEAPAVLVVPATAVHALDSTPGTDGFIVTVAASFLDRAVGQDADLVAAANRAGVYPLSETELQEHGLLDAFGRLDREFVWSAPGRRTAIMAHLQRILVALARLRQERRLGATTGMRREAELVARYRELIEEHFRSGLPLGFFATRLGVTHARLNAACRSVMGTSALKLLHNRIVIEAQRNLLYTSMTVAEVAYAVGFKDPAYFSRFFLRQVGTPPGQFRDAPRRGQPAPTSGAA